MFSFRRSGPANQESATTIIASTNSVPLRELVTRQFEFAFSSILWAFASSLLAGK
jgi:hypothetical protein